MTDRLAPQTCRRGHPDLALATPEAALLRLRWRQYWRPHYCAPAVTLAGHTRVGERCFLGIGTTTVDSVMIGDDAHSAAGAVITREVAAGALVAGVPAAVKRQAAPDGR